MTHVTRPPTEAWGLTGDLSALTGGNRNRVYRLGAGEKAFAFKSTTRSAAALEWLTPVHKAAAQAGFIVPRLRRSHGGAVVVMGWTCEPWIDGRNATWSDLGALRMKVEKFHDFSALLGQRPGFASASDMMDCDRGGDCDLSLMPPALVGLCRAAWRDLSHQPQATVHGDLNPGNVKLLQNGQFALLDWDEARRDARVFDQEPMGRDPAAGITDPAVMAWEIANAWRIEPDYARQLAQRLSDLTT